jgi:calpain-15
LNGKRTPVHVDDWIPTLRGEPLSTATSEQELWAILLEKAWAKCHGSYQRIEGGLPSNALFALTGKPSWRHLHQVASNLFSLL